MSINALPSTCRKGNCRWRALRKRIYGVGVNVRVLLGRLVRDDVNVWVLVPVRDAVGVEVLVAVAVAVAVLSGVKVAVAARVDEGVWGITGEAVMVRELMMFQRGLLSPAT